MREPEGMGMAARRHAASVTAVVTGAIAVIGMWGSWFASGSAPRNSFGFFRAAQVLGIEWVTPFRVAWFLLPIVFAAAVALMVFGLRRTGLAVLAGLGLVLGVAGALSLAAFEARTGSAAAAIAGCCTVLVAGVAMVGSRAGASPGADRGMRPGTDMGAAGESRLGEPPKLSTDN